jgi:hypothetical protein
MSAVWPERWRAGWGPSSAGAILVLISTFLPRYLTGDHAAVWAELLVAGDALAQPKSDLAPGCLKGYGFAAWAPSRTSTSRRG